MIRKYSWLRGALIGTKSMVALIFAISSLSVGCSDQLSDESNGNDWVGYGRTHSQTHYSPLSEVNEKNIVELRLAWWFDIPGVVLSISAPLEVNGILYVVTGYSVVRAFDATTGRLIWEYDPHIPEVAGRRLRILFGTRGISFLNKKIYVGTYDGRLIAIDAASGKLVWDVKTTETDDRRVITGPPLVFGDKIVIGHGVSEFAPLRGYVTAYAAETGEKLWRFYTVPGDPRKGLEDEAMIMAAKTWTGEWWREGGGGAVWNAMTFDPEFNRIYLGVGQGWPWNPESRSPGTGDNLFTSGIVALDAETGKYVWHYQTNPRDAWDYDAATDLVLANGYFEGKQRPVLMQASKNGFFYVLDRETGKLISARNYVHVTWAERIDLNTGRPVEASDSRADGVREHVWPRTYGAHSTQPMAYSPLTGLAYIPAIDSPIADTQATRCELKEQVGNGLLVAWDPTRQRPAWQVSLPGVWNGGILATAGNLVFQGRCDGKFVAYASNSGKELWSFDAQVGIIGAPISYQADGRQYVSVLAGYSGFPSIWGSRWDARTQRRRVLTFSLAGRAHLPPGPQLRKFVPVDTSTFVPNKEAVLRGKGHFELKRCDVCHGLEAVAGGTAPDLRGSPTILDQDLFSNIVKRGALVPRGMPRFDELSDDEVLAIRHYLLARAASAREEK